MPNTTKGKRNKGLIIAGLLLMAAALALTGYNFADAWRAQRAVTQVLAAMDQQEPQAATPAPAQESSGPAAQDQPEPAAGATVEIDGNDYLGKLEFPTLDLTLPVMADWSYPQLKTAPCRYVGSVAEGDLIVAGHNYVSHFGRLDQLQPGDQVVFSEVGGSRYVYTVSSLQELPGTAIDEMEAGDWDLTLFTCTLDGRGRITVRCNLADGPENE